MHQRRGRRSSLGLTWVALVCAVSGVLITVLVAWAAEVWAPDPGSASLVSTQVVWNRANGWLHEVPTDWPEAPLATAFVGNWLRSAPNQVTLAGGPRQRVRQFMGNGVMVGNPIMTFMGPTKPVLDEYRSGWPMVGNPVMTFMGPNKPVLDEYRSGWPWVTMARRGADDTRPAGLGLWSDGIGLGTLSGSGRSLPVRPLWGAFGRSAGLWGVVLLTLWMGWRGIGAWRRRRRVRRGSCGSCGYALEGAQSCPECGSDTAVA